MNCTNNRVKKQTPSKTIIANTRIPSPKTRESDGEEHEVNRLY